MRSACLIVGVGFDLVDVNELQTNVDQQPEEWLERVFTVAERTYSSQQPDPYRSFAGTLAAKEAALKALGTGWTDHSDWQDVEVIRECERPLLVMRGAVLELSKRLKVVRSFVSISHTKDHAGAVVILEI